MPDIETLVIAGVAWTGLSVLALALCHAAARADRAPGRPHPKGVPQARPSTPAVVADVGGLRAQLRAAAGLLETAQLSVSIDIDGTEAILATTRSVALVHTGEPPSVTVPILRDGRQIARLRAIRRHDAHPFDEADRRLLDAIAARLAVTMEVADGTPTVPLGHRGAMA